MCIKGLIIHCILFLRSRFFFHAKVHVLMPVILLVQLFYVFLFPFILCLILFNHFPHTDTFRCLCSGRHLKKLGQKEKLLILSNFTFCRNVFNSFRKLTYNEIFPIFEYVFSRLFATDSCMWQCLLHHCNFSEVFQIIPSLNHRQCQCYQSFCQLVHFMEH